MPSKRLDKHVRWSASGASDVTEAETLEHSLPLTARDEAIFLLHTAAEVEHALLTQYLYAAYSLKAAKALPPDQQTAIRRWRATLLGIAREEMGHLITVQNLLRLIGGPLNLEREDYPFRSDLYPFHFRLEPVSKTSLAKYVVAEMPLLADAPPEIQEIQQRATGANVLPVNRVGALYVRVARLFNPPADDGYPHLADEDFVPDIPGYQAHYAAWGDGPNFLIPDVRTRAEALTAIQELSEQGEGLEDTPTHFSHYQRFLGLYREFPEPGTWEPANLVPVDPNTSLPGTGAQEALFAAGRITHPRACGWVQLCNLRYRLLLAYLAHFLLLDGPLREPDGRFTLRGLLQQGTFDEMRRVGRLAGWLATLPRWEDAPDAPERAGAPFELPFTLALPDRDPDRWRNHADVLEAAIGVIERLQADPADAADAYLRDLLERDRAMQVLVRAAARGQPLAGPGPFRRVVGILDAAVRGFRVGAHHNFWRNCTRDEFVQKSIFGLPLLAVTPDGRFDPAESNLLKALRGEPPFDGPDEAQAPQMPRMPAHRPPLPPEDLAFVAQWIAAGCPDDDPPGTIGLADEPEPGTGVGG
jgi:hypothetical protein